MSSSENQREGLRQAQIHANRGMQMASGNQATKRGYRHRVVPRGTSRPAAPPGTRGVPPHAKLRDPLPQARPMSGRARLASYGAESVEQLTGKQARRYRAKMNRQVNRRSGIARTLRGREHQLTVREPQPEPENLVKAAEAKTLLKRINEVWRRSR